MPYFMLALLAFTLAGSSNDLLLAALLIVLGSIFVLKSDYPFNRK